MTKNYTYCGFTLDAIVAMPAWHQAALEAARSDLRSADAFARIDQCSQEALDSARDRLAALELALAEV